MPAKKKKAAKKVSRPAAPTRSTHPLHKHYFMEEQDEFFRKHPSAQMLLTVFLVAVVVFFVFIYMNRSYYMPGMKTQLQDAEKQEQMNTLFEGQY